MQLRMEFAFGEKLKEEYSDEEEFVSDEEIDGFLFLYSNDKVHLIFFEEDFDNLDEGPKFDNDGCYFMEDKVVFVDGDSVIEVVSHKNLQVLEVVVDDEVKFEEELSMFENFAFKFY
ncbi:hypothetical protein Syun_004237 [Stephania yunnanensis]|uniref:Uncharacterized protein n=1 Tax=Stephania yunnanensis TaxID=152371 RepID=A0AAP0L570_9MAGN